MDAIKKKIAAEIDAAHFSDGKEHTVTCENGKQYFTIADNNSEIMSKLLSIANKATMYYTNGKLPSNITHPKKKRKRKSVNNKRR